jgi:hypothetical protein
VVAKVVIFNKVVIRFQQIWLEKTDNVMKVKAEIQAKPSIKLLATYWNLV